MLLYFYMPFSWVETARMWDFYADFDRVYRLVYRAGGQIYGV